MNNNLQEILEDNPVIASVKDDTNLEEALISDCSIVFILYGNVLNISEIVKKIKDRGKMAFINVDLLEGFSAKEVVIQFLKQQTQVDGILSSRVSMIKAAKSHGFITIHRFFFIDSFSLNNLDKQVEISKPDYLEILPGWPKLITWTREKTNIPIISGGLICLKEDAIAALKAGAIAISSTNKEVWSA